MVRVLREACVTRANTRDFAAFPGTIAPVFVAPSKVSSRKPACRPCSSGPWQATHFFPNNGRISRWNSGVCPYAHTAKTAKTILNIVPML
jgi:hypothetical protein